MIAIDNNLKIFRQSVTGKPYEINQFVSIRSPTLGEICDLGEQRYYSMVSTICANSSAYKVALWDMAQINWETVDDWQMFNMLRQGLSNEQTSILLGNLDLSKLELAQNNQTNETVLVTANENGEPIIVIDRAIYTFMAEYIRQMHGFEYKEDKAENKFTRKYMIERERRKLEKQKNDDTRKSILEEMIASMISQPGFDYNYTTVWDLPLAAFNKSVSRTKKYLEYVQTIQAVHAGADMKNVSWEEIHWLT